MLKKITMLQILLPIWLILGYTNVLAEDVRLIKQGGVYHLPVKINDTIQLKFIVDTGAADVHIPADVALTLIRAGTISKADIHGKAAYQMADGTIKENTKLILRSLQVGAKVIRNVEASVGPVEGSLLLGQSALEKLEPWRIETGRGIFVLDNKAHDSNVNNSSTIDLSQQQPIKKRETVKWKAWNNWDDTIKSYAEPSEDDDVSTDIKMALVELIPDAPHFLFIQQTGRGYCGSGGCSLSIHSPIEEDGKAAYEPFQSLFVRQNGSNISIRKDVAPNGWYPIIIDGVTWVFQNGEYHKL